MKEGVFMPTITKKLFEEYEQLRHDRDNGRIEAYV